MTRGQVHVVEDSAEVRESLADLLASRGHAVRTYASADEFLTAIKDDGPGCLIVDVRLPGMGGLDLQQRLASDGPSMPVIVISGHADVSMAVRALKAGAVDFLEKPFRGAVLLERVEAALAEDRRAWPERRQCAALRAGLERLSERERAVLHRVADGRYNKVIAAELGLSMSTVEAHRQRIMRKLGAHTLYELVKAAELDEAGGS